MQKWEYLEVVRDGFNIIQQLNGVNVGKQKLILFFDYVKQLGIDGWELATQSEWNRLIFKRPLP